MTATYGGGNHIYAAARTACGRGCFYGTPLRHTAGRIFLRAGKKFYYSISILCEGSCLGWLLGTVSVSIPLSYFAFTFSLSISSPT